MDKRIHCIITSPGDFLRVVEKEVGRTALAMASGIEF